MQGVYPLAHGSAQQHAREHQGNHGTRDAGSAKRGNQKATYGSAVSPEAAEGQAEAIKKEPEQQQK